MKVIDKIGQIFSVGSVSHPPQHVNDLTHVDCQGLAGHWTYATGLAGFDLVHRASLGAFGDSVLESNRILVPGPWEQDPGRGLDEWTPWDNVAYLTGTPPCSGFSLLNKSKKNNARGPESNINDCMWELVRYAARCKGPDGKNGPFVVSFESVQGAYTQGRGLMQALRAELERLTKQKYTLTHVLMSGASVGNAQMRKRYYFVVHRVPFGVDTPEKRRVATYKDAIGDLVELPTDSWGSYGVETDPEQDWWLIEQGMLKPAKLAGNKGDHVVDAHVSAYNDRIRILIEELEPFWPAGKNLEFAMKAFRDKKKRFPEGAERWWDPKTDSLKGYNHPTRVHPDKVGYVCTGNCVTDFVHYSEPRMLSLRECSRMMGLPDMWKWDTVTTPQNGGRYVGKCCPCQSGKWISTWVRRSLEGSPGTAQTLIGEREYLHNSTLAYVPWLKEQQLAERS